MRSMPAFVVVAATAAVALGTAAVPTWASDGFSLQLSGSSSAVAGQPLSLTATGKNPAVGDYPYVTYLDVELFRPSAVAACPATQSAAGQLAPATGGAVLAWDVPTDSDAAGNFSIPFGLTPLAPGPVLLCGYTAGLAGETLATASMTLPVQSSAPATPQSLAPPHLRRSGHQVICDAGRWSNGPTRFSFAWLVDGRGQPGATGRILLVTRKLRGHKVQCRVTASNDGGRGTALSGRLSIH